MCASGELVEHVSCPEVLEHVDVLGALARDGAEAREARGAANHAPQRPRHQLQRFLQRGVGIGGEAAPRGDGVALRRRVAQAVDRRVDRRGVHRPRGSSELVLVVAAVAVVVQERRDAGVEICVLGAQGDVVKAIVEGPGEVLVGRDEAAELPQPLRELSGVDVARAASDAVAHAGRNVRSFEQPIEQPARCACSATPMQQPVHAGALAGRERPQPVEQLRVARVVERGHRGEPSLCVGASDCQRLHARAAQRADGVLREAKRRHQVAVALRSLMWRGRDVAHHLQIDLANVHAGHALTEQSHGAGVHVEVPAEHAGAQ